MAALYEKNPKPWGQLCFAESGIYCSPFQDSQGNMTFSCSNLKEGGTMDLKQLRGNFPKQVNSATCGALELYVGLNEASPTTYRFQCE